MSPLSEGAVRIVPVVEPLRRRLGLPDARRAAVSLRVRLPFAVDRGRFHAAVREVVARCDAFRLHVVEGADSRGASVILGPPHPIDLRVETDAAGSSIVTLRAPALGVDRRSLELVIERAVAMHQAGTAVAPAPADGEVSYLDVADWLDSLTQSVEGARGKLYWRRAMHDDALAGTWPEPVSMPVDVSIDVPMPRACLALAADEREALAAAAWLHVARVMTGRRHLAVGYVADGRAEEALRDAIGPLSRVIPMTMDDACRSTHEVMRSMAERLAAGRQWQELFAFDAGASDARRMPFFPYVFEYVAEARRDLPPFDVEARETEFDRSLVWLRCEEWNGRWRGALRSRHPDLTEDFLRALAERWSCVLWRSAESPDRTFGEPDVLTSRERQALPWRGERREVDGTVHDTLNGVCARHADRIAVRANGGAVTFARLQALARELAATLPPIAPEAIVAVDADGTPESIAATIAVLSLGGACLPSSSTSPEARPPRMPRATTASPIRHVTHPNQLAFVLNADAPGAESRAIGVSHRAVLNLWSGLAGGGQYEPMGVSAIPYAPAIRRIVTLLSGRTLDLTRDDDRPVRVGAGGDDLLAPPACNTECFIADHRWRPLPDHCTGEVMIAGAVLPRGYMGDAARTAERFVPYLFGHGSRAFRTAELAERRGDATVRHRRPTIDRAALDANVAPLGANLAASEASALVEPPVTPLETQLLAEWQRILDGRAIGVDTTFFDAGGDSFAILQLNLRLRGLLDVDVPVVDMFRYPTIRHLARHVATLGARVQ